MNIEDKATVDYVHTTEEKDPVQSKQAEQHPKHVSGNYNVNKKGVGPLKAFIVVAMACQSLSPCFSKPPASAFANLTHVVSRFQ